MLRTLSELEAKSATVVTYVLGIGENRCNGMMMELMIEGHCGVTNHTGVEGHRSYMGLKGVKGPAMPIVRAMSLGAASADMGMETESMRTISVAASSVVATCARAPRVVIRVVL